MEDIQDSTKRLEEQVKKLYPVTEEDLKENPSLNEPVSIRWMNYNWDSPPSLVVSSRPLGRGYVWVQILLLLEQILVCSVEQSCDTSYILLVSPAPTCI